MLWVTLRGAVALEKRAAYIHGLLAGESGQEIYKKCCASAIWSGRGSFPTSKTSSSVVAMSVRREHAYRQSVWHANQQPAIMPEYKVILLGVPGVGKTSFFLRIRENAFINPDSSTCPIDYLVKRVQVSNSPLEDVTVKIILYDTAGGERFRTLTSNFYQNACAAILMYSEDDSYSFDKLQIEVENAQPFVEKDFVWAVVGSKSDLQRDPLIYDSKIKAFCDNVGTELQCTMSAKTGENVEHVLEMVASELYKIHSGFLNISMRDSMSGDTVQLCASDSVDGGKVARRKGCKRWRCDIQ